LHTQFIKVYPEHIPNIYGTKLQVVNEDLLNRAKDLFMKRNRVLYRSMNPEISVYKTNKFLSAAWNSMPSNDKQFYVCQVMYCMSSEQ
jgi:hypothetical protein